MLKSSTSSAAVNTASVRRRGAARAAGHSVFVVIPALLMAWVLVFVWNYQRQAVDFRLQFLPAGLAVLHGASPYGAINTPIHPATAFPYPAATGLLFALFAMIPSAASGTLYVALCIAAPLAALRALDVRDVRLYGFVLVLDPVFVGWQTANLTLPLVLGVALIWRYRDRPALAGALTALLVSLKPFLWPLALWLIATRRDRAVLVALAAGVVINLIAWAIVGFDQVRALVRVTVAVTNTFHRWGYSTVAIAMHLGASRAVATGLAALAAAGLAAACIVAGRRGRDRLALLVACDLVLAASPIVWSHYFALMIVPLAILSPRLSAAWVLQLAFWCCPVTEAATWQCLVALLVTVATSWLLVRKDDSKARSVTPAASPREKDDEHQKDPKDKPPRVVEADEVVASAGFGPELIPAPAKLVGRFELVFAVRADGMMLLDQARVATARTLRRRKATGVLVGNRDLVSRPRLGRTAVSWGVRHWTPRRCDPE